MTSPTPMASLTLDQLRDIQRQIKGTRQENGHLRHIFPELNSPVAEHLKLIDVITLWLWKHEDLADVDSDLASASCAAWLRERRLSRAVDRQVSEANPRAVTATR